MLKPATTADLTVQAGSNLTALADDWRELQTRGWTTVFQTYEWCESWFNTAGRASGTIPCIVTGRDDQGKLKFLLPLGVTQRSGAGIVHWLSDTVATYGLGVYDPTWVMHANQGLDPFWPEIRSVLPPADVIWLSNLPEVWAQIRHPLHGQFTTADANRSFFLHLNTDFDTLYTAKRNSKSRARARKKIKQLQEVGKLEFGLPEPGPNTHSVLNDMFRHQTERLARIGVHNVFDKHSMAFVHKLAGLPEGENTPLLRPYVLSIDGKTVAVKLGIVYANTFWAMVSSLKADGLERMSPGDIALRKTIEACCNSGLSFMDMAQGESDYKMQWADGSIQLHTITQPLNTRGILWARTVSLGQNCKRAIKTNDILWPIAQRLRTQLLGRKKI